MAELRILVGDLRGMLATRDARIAELERLLAESRRSAKRQASSFSKGEPADEPAKPGRKAGKAHGRHGHRLPPPEPDRMLDAPLPEACPHCGGEVEHEHDADQHVTDLPALLPPTTTPFRLGVGRCRSCGARRAPEPRLSSRTSPNRCGLNERADPALA